MHTMEMLRAHPAAGQLDADALARCIDECFTCAQTCTACADACLGEGGVAELVRCTRVDLDCADVCDATGKILTRQTGFDAALARTMVSACAEACHLCAAECARHASHHEHCRICAEACRRCERACEDLLSAVGT